MVRGGPGSGKTILGLHFLTWAAERGEVCLLITFGESESELRRNAERMGFRTEGIHFLDLSPDSSNFAQGQDYDIFPPSEVEKDPITRRIREEVARLKPARVFVDGLTQLRHITANPFQFRKEAQAFLRFLSEMGSTVMFTSESNEGPDEDLQFIADAVIELEFQESQRQVGCTEISRFGFSRGQAHAAIDRQRHGRFPAAAARRLRRAFPARADPLRRQELDQLTNGGLERGTITIITGPSGVGKSTVGMQFVSTAAARGERCVVYLFEEWRESLIRRCEAIRIPVRR